LVSKKSNSSRHFRIADESSYSVVASPGRRVSPLMVGVRRFRHWFGCHPDGSSDPRVLHLGGGPVDVAVVLIAGQVPSALFQLDRAPSGGGVSGVMPGVAQVPVVMLAAEVVSVSRVLSSSASDVSVR
jgi:hypothetical protein